MTGGGAYVDPTYARTDDYRRDLDEIVAAGVCPFCPENFRWHPNPVLATDGDWFITQIRENYPNADHQWLIIGHVHKEALSELSHDDLASIYRLAILVTEAAGIPGGSLALRFGPPEYTGATVRHLHYHLVVPKLNPQTGRAIPVMFPIG